MPLESSCNDIFFSTQIWQFAYHQCTYLPVSLNGISINIIRPGHILLRLLVCCCFSLKHNLWKQIYRIYYACYQPI